MARGSGNRGQLREERLRAEAAEQARARRDRLLKLGGAAVIAALLIVVVLVVVSQSGDDDGGSSAASTERLLAGIPQRGTVLGDPAADVTVVEYGDLQCPVCKDYAETIVPELIRGPVRRGEAKLDFRNWTIIGPDSVTAAEASLAAAEQGRYWQFVEVFYEEQGAENSGYVSDDFLRGIAEQAGVPDLDRWEEDRASGRWQAQLRRAEREATGLRFTGTPSFAIERPDGTTPLGTPGSAAEVEQAIAQAAGEGGG